MRIAVILSLSLSLSLSLKIGFAYGKSIELKLELKLKLKLNMGNRRRGIIIYFVADFFAAMLAWCCFFIYRKKNICYNL